MGLDALHRIYVQQRRKLLRQARFFGAEFPNRIVAEAFVCLYEHRAHIADAPAARAFLRHRVRTLAQSQLLVDC